MGPAVDLPSSAAEDLPRWKALHPQTAFHTEVPVTQPQTNQAAAHEAIDGNGRAPPGPATDYPTGHLWIPVAWN